MIWIPITLAIIGGLYIANKHGFFRSGTFKELKGGITNRGYNSTGISRGNQSG